jgi:transcriptional regulator with XRE-family HTH domain
MALLELPRPQPAAGVIRMSGLRQADVAAAVGCSEGHLSDVLNGRRHPSAILGRALEQLLEVPAELLFLD